MNTSYSKPGKSGILHAKTSVILFLLFVQIAGHGSNLHAQSDSLEIEAVPLREIANEAAHDMQQTRDILVAKVQVSNNFDLLPQIDSLEIRIAELDELTKKTLDSRFDYTYYSSLQLRWERQRVINWTLSKYTRRIIMTIHTHQDTDTAQVLKIMKEAAGEVEYVLKEPQAKSYFHGIKDNEFEFALFYWASGNILDCKSAVNQQVQKALKEAGIEFVMPLHVLMQKDQKPE